MYKHNIISGFVFVIIIFAITSCNQNQKAKQEKDALVSHIDSTVKPGDDFFMYADGNGSRIIRYLLAKLVMADFSL